MDPLLSILKFSNTVIHYFPKCFVTFLTIELFLAAAEHVVVFSFIEHFYGMSKVFTERLASYYNPS